jgi:hypothetical protein
MRRLALALAVLAGLVPAGAEPSGETLPAKPIIPDHAVLRRIIFGTPDKDWQPEPRITVIKNDYGDLLREHDARWRKLAAEDGHVHVLGTCMSGCTMVTAHIKKDRLCFGIDGNLQFHSARTGSFNGPASPKTNKWMFDHYPEDIRGWLVAHGGREKLPLNGFWILTAKELWQMGYRKCGYRAGAREP